MEHNIITNALAYEASQQSLADQFYRNQYPGIQIIRYSWDNPEGQKQQRRGIDVELVFPDGHRLAIQEKFRSSNFPDVWIEILSDLEHNKLGWGIMDECDIYAFFHEPNREVRIIPREEIRRFAGLALTRAELFREVENQENGVIQEDLKNSQGTFENIDFRVVPSFAGENKWVGASICVPLEYFNEIQIYSY